MLKAGIVGLPNVGKSTLFNALTRTRKAESANYPFCTIDPNVGIVNVPDERLEKLRRIVKTDVVIPAAIEIADIAGLVEGASRGEGLGNQFLSNIREVDAIIHVVRCFDDDDIIHSLGSVDPLRDIEIVNTELILSDLAAMERRLDRARKKARSHDKEAMAEAAFIEKKVLPHLNETRPALTLEMSPEEQEMLLGFFLLSAKPVIYAANVAEDDLSAAEENEHVGQVRKYATEHHQAACVPISARLEAELVDLSPEEAKEFLTGFGVSDSGVSQLIQATYKLLGLITFFTAGEKEVRAWTVVRGARAPQAAGVIHTDFEKGFIKAEVVACDVLVEYGSYAGVREGGKYRLEGKDYIFHDGDVAHFRFSN